MTIRIDELTGLPTTRTGVVPREPGALGPGAEWETYCVHYTGPTCPFPAACPCGGRWEVWMDHGRRTLVYRHIPPEGRVYTRTFDWERHRNEREITDCIGYLVATEVHPVNAPTPGRARR
jgi:hypothetical protein